jgi:hypothetical protein
MENCAETMMRGFSDRQSVLVPSPYAHQKALSLVPAVLHPGRKFAEKLADSSLTPEFLIARVADYLAGRPLARLPKVIAEQQEREQGEDDADEA